MKQPGLSIEEEVRNFLAVRYPNVTLQQVCAPGCQFTHGFHPDDYGWYPVRAQFVLLTGLRDLDRERFEQDWDHYFTPRPSSGIYD